MNEGRCYMERKETHEPEYEQYDGDCQKHVLGRAQAVPTAKRAGIARWHVVRAGTTFAAKLP
jgi:hypothetical protein